MKQGNPYIKTLKSPTGFFGALVIGLFILMAIPGYLITPDSTSNAYNNHLELAELKPGSKALILAIPRKNVEKVSLLTKWVKGTPKYYDEYVIKSWDLQGTNIVFQQFVNRTHTQESNIDLKEIIQGPINSETAGELVHQRRFWLGTDGAGADLLSRIIIGARISLSVGLIAVFISLVIGITLGLISGYYGGKIDALIMWLVNVMWSLPTLLLVIAISFILGKGFWQIFIAVGLSMWVDITRIIRGQVLSIKEQEYISAAKVLGIGNLRIMFKHILPNIKGPIIVIAASNFASAILLEAGLSFLGLGVTPPTPSWGMMANENYGYIVTDSAYLAIIPGLAIMLLVMAFNLLGNALRDALDVKL